MASANRDAPTGTDVLAENVLVNEKDVPGGALCAGIPLRPLRADRSLRASRPLRTNRPLRANGPLHALLVPRDLFLRGQAAFVADPQLPFVLAVATVDHPALVGDRGKCHRAHRGSAHHDAKDERKAVQLDRSEHSNDTPFSLDVSVRLPARS